MNLKASLNLKDVGERLRAIREELDLTLEKIGELAGFSKSQISAAERGEKKPSTAYLFALIDNFKVNINYILTGDGDPFLDHRNKSEDEKDMDELFSLMKKEKMLRYSILGYYYEYKKRNRDFIAEFRAEN